MWKTLLLILIFVQSAHAYQFTRDFQNGFYWKDLPLNISVIEKENPERKDLLDQLTLSAVQDWESATGLSIWNIVGEGKTSNIIRWSNEFSKETRMDDTTVLAVAVRYTEGPYFARAEIIINGNHPLNSIVSYLYTTIKHELGHTMGLDHSDVKSSIMWPELQEYGVGVGEDDVKGMIAAYDTMTERQLTRYVSPLAYEQKSESQGLSCATVTTTPMVAGQGIFSLLLGILISFVRKIKSKFK